MNAYTYSRGGLALTEHFEADGGPVLKSFWDAIGKVYTIGYGSTGPDIVAGLVWSPAQCEARLLRDVSNACLHVNHLVTRPITQNQFDALVDFAYNAGCGAFASSTLLKLVNEGAFDEADLEFGKWVNGGGRVVPGLVRRRAAEAKLFSTPVQ